MPARSLAEGQVTWKKSTILEKRRNSKKEYTIIGKVVMQVHKGLFWPVHTFLDIPQYLP